MNFKKTNTWLIASGIVLAAVIIIQLFSPTMENPPITQDIILPAKVKSIFRNSCYDCHSNETKLAWFDKIGPAPWLVKSHIEKGRNALNFSEWDRIPDNKRKGKLFQAINDIISGEMPLPSYSALHHNSISKKDINIIKDYLASICSPIKLDSPSTHNYKKQQSEVFQNHMHNKGHLNKNDVQPTLNHIDYIPDYWNWKAISTTDRFDNGTMRVIYGNEIAVKAIEEGNINPWPNGSILAKTAWKQLADVEGNISTGEFIQVEYMIKDTDKYQDTKGWGWARWRGKSLIPYGENLLFTQECIDCHRPVKNTDYVFTYPLPLNK